MSGLRPAHVTGASLAELAATCGATARGAAQVSGVSLSSAGVLPGDLFAALPGRLAHGIRYLDEARSAGAVAVLTDATGAAEVPADMPVLVVADPRFRVGPIAATVYGHPSRSVEVIGITGTSGKTTTSYLLRAGLAAAGRTNGLIGTVGTFLGEERLATGLTTPEAPDLQALLAVMAERGVHTCVMEVSSHALSLGRAEGTEFAVAGFTNLSQDHLDFHADMEEYFAAKARLFDGRARRAVVVVDDSWGRRLAEAVGPAAVTVSTTGAPASWRAVDITTAADGSTSFTALGPDGAVPAGSRIPGAYNVANALLALALLHEVGVPASVAAPAVRAAQVPGRMERIDAGQDFIAVVDYSHKPAAVDGALRRAAGDHAGASDRRAGLRRGPRPGQAPGHGPGRGRRRRRADRHRRQPTRRGTGGHPARDARGRAHRPGARASRGPRGRGPRGGDRHRHRPGRHRRHGAGGRQGPRDRPGDRRPGPPVRRPHGRPGPAAADTGPGMIALSLGEIASIVGGELAGGADPATLVTGHLSFDSRAVVPGGLFLALPGARADGHDFAAAAASAGAAAALCTRPVDVPCIVVADGHAALAALASAVLKRLPDLTVVGVTGSSGKTSTKDLLAALLTRLGPTVAPPGSFNNELGHPYTVLLATEETRYLVLEKSARGIGHIAYLTSIAPPRIGVVLNVGSAHVGEFGSRAAIAQAKGELVEALPAAADGGVAVLNLDDPAVAAMAARTSARVVTVGESERADLRAENVSVDELGRPRFDLVTAHDRAGVALQLSGEHHVGNALAAAAVALECGLPLHEVATGLSAATAASRWRMEVTERADGTVIVNDAYNANPESMRAALKTVAMMARGRRSWAVLGTMAELGEESDAAHDSVGRLAVRLNISQLVAVGDGARLIASGAALEGSWDGEAVWVPDREAALARVRERSPPGDVVLVKASRSAGLESVALALAADSAGDQPGPDEDGGAP